jgi:hypothetical protein
MFGVETDSSLPTHRPLIINSVSMGPGALTEINEEILLACLQGFARRGFSGDFECRMEGRQIPAPSASCTRPAR